MNFERFIMHNKPFNNGKMERILELVTYLGTILNDISRVFVAFLTIFT